VETGKDWRTASKQEAALHTSCTAPSNSCFLSRKKKCSPACCLQCWDPKKDRAILVCLPFSCISMCVMCRGGPWLCSVLVCLYNTIMCSIIRSRDRNSLWFGGWNAAPNLLGCLSSCGHRITNAIDRKDDVQRRDQVNLRRIGSRPHGMNSERERVTPWCYSIVAESVRDRLDKRLFRAASAFT